MNLTYFRRWREQRAIERLARELLLAHQCHPQTAVEYAVILYRELHAAAVTSSSAGATPVDGQGQPE